MDCRKAQSLFSACFDNDISAEIPELEAHFKTCDTCAAEFYEYAKLINEVRALPEPELPRNLPQTLVSYVKRNRKQKRSTAFMWASTVVAAAASLIFVFVWFATAPEAATEGFIEPFAIEGRGLIEPNDEYMGIMPIGGEISWDDPADDPVLLANFVRNGWLLLAFVFLMCAVASFLIGLKTRQKQRIDINAA